MNSALVIMAAGIGSRFGAGIKQLTPVGPNGECIIDYSVYDALKAGFTKVVFIIRPELEQQLREDIGNKIAKKIGEENVLYVYQTLDALPEGFDVQTLTAQRTKPWGTGQAVLSCRGKVTDPFCVINADDFYGAEPFAIVHNFLAAHANTEKQYCMAGFVLRNTLSDYGSVTRGVCCVDGSRLVDVTETHDIVKTADGAEAQGKNIDVNSMVSMNMWGFTPDFLDTMEQGFCEFLRTGDLKKGEYLLPGIVGEQLRNGEITVDCIKTDSTWFGVTYSEDKPVVVREIGKLIEQGVYPEKLWE